MKGVNIQIYSNLSLASAEVERFLEPLQREAMGSLRFTNLEFVSLAETLDTESALVILNFPRWASDQEASIRSIRSRGYMGPILLIAANIGLWNAKARLSPEFRRVALLPSPYERSDLIGLVRRLISQKAMKYRIYPRYEVEIDATLTVGDAGAVVPCTLRNVSLGGACIGLSTNVSLTPGQFATLSFKLEDNAPEKSMRCRIAWTQATRALIGAEFVRTLEL